MAQRKKVTWYSIFILVILGMLFAVTTYYYYTQKSAIVDSIATRDVQQLQHIFDQINQDCGILSFDYDINYIDFLTVGSFAGSEVGTMNLMYPKKWEGPYISDNPTLQDKYYVVARLSDGYYITPGMGVTLSDERVVGTDIIISPDVSSQSLDALQDDDKPLLAQVPMRGKSSSHSVSSFQATETSYP